MMKQFIKLIPIAALAVAMVSCQAGKDNPGRTYMPDMTYSNAYETFSSSEIKSAEGYDMSARLPVKGTIPHGWIPTDEKIKTNPLLLMGYMAKNHFAQDPAKWQEEFDRASATIQNPVPYSDDVKSEGKALYAVNCQVCHGEAGDGNGQIVNGGDGPYTAVPPNYKTNVPNYKDGGIFYIVSYGRNMMGPYALQLSVDERWKVVHYIKSLAGVGGSAASPADSTKVKG